ncbi:uncharacterized protein LOC126654122 [Mercurialis annua]|uniref:uncharacterized protein LOC126654122 n=1 Tax=Mercurialis annua TaxID=3986 RepID=UPI0024AFD543|nr:uncharacterized protein LOC126654122 [Mercurialis annua]
MERIHLQSEAGSSIGTYARSHQLGTMEDRRDTQWPPPEPVVPPQPLPHIDPPTVDVQRIRGRRRGRARPHEETREMPANPMPPPVDFHGDTEDFIRQYYGPRRITGAPQRRHSAHQLHPFRYHLRTLSRHRMIYLGIPRTSLAGILLRLLRYRLRLYPM